MSASLLKIIVFKNVCLCLNQTKSGGPARVHHPSPSNQLGGRQMKTKKPSSSNILPTRYTADFIKKVLSLYTNSMTTIYLSLSAQVAKSTFFMKSPVLKDGDQCPSTSDQLGRRPIKTKKPSSSIILPTLLKDGD